MVRQLDDIQDEAYRRQAIYGDRYEEYLSTLPVQRFEVSPTGPTPTARPASLSLNGEWRMKSHSALSDNFRTEERGSWMSKPGGFQPAWWREGTDRTDWQVVEVPTTVQTALIKSGDLEDPMWNANTYVELTEFGEPKETPWPLRKTRIEQQDWWFARTFLVPTEWQDQVVELNFEGVDYSASVYVNGHSLGNHAGMFGGPKLDVTGLLKFGEVNELVLRLDAVPEHWYGRPKGSGGYGWHYGHLVATGIWRDVTLRPKPSADLSAVFVKTMELTESGGALISIQFDVEMRPGVVGPVEVHGSLRTPEGDERSFSAEISPLGINSRFETTVELEHAQIWWPHGFGEQPQYTLDLAIGESGAVSAASTKFGIRTFEMLALADWEGEDLYRWEHVVNGVPMFIKGANWCWSDPVLKGEREKYEHILELAVRANIQFLRVWGAGNIEEDYFFELCDAKGILVYQEFPFAWGPPDAPIGDAAVTDRQVRVVVERLRNHPCLVMWGGGNENGEPVGADELLFLIGRRCRQLDPSRPYHRSSPWGGSAHNYRVFHDGLPIDTGYRSMDTVMWGEYGLPSFPNRESVERYLPSETLSIWPPRARDGGVIMHLPQFDYFDIVKQLRYADYGPVRDWQTMIDYSQFAQGDALRFAAELLRGQPRAHTAGFVFYKMTDLFPGDSWAIVDYYGVAKTSYYRAKQVCSAQSAFAVAESLSWSGSEDFFAEVWAANDTSKSLRATVRTRSYDASLALVVDSSMEASLAPGDRARVGTVGVPSSAHLGEVFLLSIALEDETGAVLSDQWYWFNAKKKSEAVRRLEAHELWALDRSRSLEYIQLYAEDGPTPLRELPRTTLQVSYECRPDSKGGVVTVHNTGHVPAFNVVIGNLPNGWGNYLDDNCFALHAGEEREIRFESKERVAEFAPSITAWNVD